MDRQDDIIQSLLRQYMAKTNEGNGVTYVNSIRNKIKSYLDSGIKVTLIREAIEKTQCKFLQFTSYIDGIAKMDPSNLIEPKKFYFHPYLQIAPPIPTIRVEEDGSVTRISPSKFYLKIKGSVVMDDILNYAYTLFPTLQKVYKRDIAGMRYLHKMCEDMISKSDKRTGVDLLLFTIDAISMISDREGEILTNLLKISDYVKEGLSLYEDRINSCVELESEFYAG
jgi:hypothetical protein